MLPRFSLSCWHDVSVSPPLGAEACLCRSLFVLQPHSSALSFVFTGSLFLQLSTPTLFLPLDVTVFMTFLLSWLLPSATTSHCSSSQARVSSYLYPSRFSCKVSCCNVSSKGLVSWALALFEFPLHFSSRASLGVDVWIQDCYFVLKGYFTIV